MLQLKFTCEQNALNEAIINVSKATAAKSPIQALEGIKMFINKNYLELTGYDMEIGIQTTIPCESEDYGEFVFDTFLLGEIVRKMPSERLVFEIDDKMITTIKGDISEYKILALSADEYPCLPVYDKDNFFTLPQSLLKDMINQTIYAVAVIDTKPILMGELFDISGGIFNLVAIDGYRLAIRTEKMDTDDRFNFVIKAKALSEVSKLLKDDDNEKVTVYVSKKHVTFEISGYMVITRVLEGEFHNYKGSLPTSFVTEGIVNTKQLISSLERCIFLINDKVKAPVKCLFDNGKVVITCATGLGKFYDEFDVDISGPMVEIGFNCRYLLEALRATYSDKVRLQLNGGLAPMKIIPLEGDAYTFLVLPVRLKAD